MVLSDWIPAPNEDGETWYVYKEVEFSDGAQANVTLAYGVTERMARTLAQRLNG